MSSDATSLADLGKDTRKRSTSVASPADNHRDKKAGRGEDVQKFKTSHPLKGPILLWLCLIHIVGVFYFTQGFLLTRLILEDHSTCNGVPIQRCNTSPLSEGCWYPRKFRKAVIVVIDALRYDFTVPFSSSDASQRPQQYHGAFPVLYNYSITRPENAFLLPFLADPPTTTLQRLKGLTTGSLPTFWDAGSNFAGTIVEEDNLLTQMRDQGNTLVHFGDDTWQSLFPGAFDRDISRPYDSFNVWDLHTVDDGVVTHLLPLLRAPNITWDVIFGHFLGVDHAGHRYGPDHPAMAAKLRQMNEVVTRMIEMLDEETLLVVMGDHGMDSKGDHGGESDEEVEAALWMYSARPMFGRTHPDFIPPPATAKVRPVRQTDLVSTLSLLLGLPIPFNNIGAPIEEAFSEPSGPNWRALACVNDIAFAQIRRYQDKYSEARDSKSDAFDFREFDKLPISDTTFWEPKSSGNESRFEEAYAALRHQEDAVLRHYRRLWANFDLGQMSVGVSILTVGLICLLSMSASMPTFESGGLTTYVGGATVIGLCLTLLSDAVLDQQVRPLIALLGAAVSGLLAAFGSIALNFSRVITPFPNNVWSWLAVFFTASQATGFASNSYTIHEDSILLYFLSTFGFICCASSLRQREASDRFLGITHSALFSLLSRVVSSSRICREEQMPACRSTFYASSNSSTSAPWQIFIPFFIALLLPALIKTRVGNTAFPVGPAKFWSLSWFRGGLVLIAVYWMLDTVDNGGWAQNFVSADILKTAELTLSRSVIGIVAIGGIVISTRGKLRIDDSTASQKLAGDQSMACRSQATPTTAIPGYVNFYGTRYFSILPAMLLLASLVLPPMGQFSIAVCAYQILCLLEMLHVNRLTIASSPSHRYRVKTSSTSVGPVVLALLGSYHFFKTGHQATLASIQWNAAFVPLRKIIYPWSPLLVLFNTFGPQILCALAVPLTVLWKAPISVKENKQDVVTRQELDWQLPMRMRRLMGDVMKALLVHMSYYATIQLATTLWAGHLRRHLMLYRVFMPRFLMATALLIVMDLIILLGSWITLRTGALSIGGPMGRS